MRTLAPLIIAVASSSALADASFQNGQRLCKAMRSSGATTCEVTSNYTVDATIDMTSASARQTCSGVVDQMIVNGLRFEKGWELRIFSPESVRPVATCGLP